MRNRERTEQRIEPNVRSSSHNDHDVHDHHPSVVNEENGVGGRLDGMDVLSLGSARNVRYVTHDKQFLVGQRLTTRDLVDGVLWGSCGGRVERGGCVCVWYSEGPYP